jgi:hypothetical protein
MTEFAHCHITLFPLSNSGICMALWARLQDCKTYALRHGTCWIMHVFSPSPSSSGMMMFSCSGMRMFLVQVGCGLGLGVPFAGSQRSVMVRPALCAAGSRWSADSEVGDLQQHTSPGWLSASARRCHDRLERRCAAAGNQRLAAAAAWRRWACAAALLLMLGYWQPARAGRVWLRCCCELATGCCCLEVLGMRGCGAGNQRPTASWTCAAAGAGCRRGRCGARDRRGSCNQSDREVLSRSARNLFDRRGRCCPDRGGRRCWNLAPGLIKVDGGSSGFFVLKIQCDSFSINWSPEVGILYAITSVPNYKPL